MNQSAEATTPTPTKPRRDQSKMFGLIVAGTGLDLAEFRGPIREILSTSSDPLARLAAEVRRNFDSRPVTVQDMIDAYHALRAKDGNAYDLERWFLRDYCGTERHFLGSADVDRSAYPVLSQWHTLEDAAINRVADRYVAFRASSDWREWCNKTLAEFRDKPSAHSAGPDAFLWRKFNHDSPDVVLGLARDKAAIEAKDAADVQAALIERLRRAAVIRADLRKRGISFTATEIRDLAKGGK